MLTWIKNHFNTLYNLQLQAKISDKTGSQLSLDEGFKNYIKLIDPYSKKQKKLIFIGNGGSAGIASHLSIDYSKNGNIPSITFSDFSALTCLSNDYGYNHVFAKQIEFHARAEDILIAISSSGKSENILNAVKKARQLGCAVITFSGFDAQNPLAKLGDLNFYVDSNEYGYVEVAHLSLGHAILDYIIEHRQDQEHQVDRISAIA